MFTCRYWEAEAGPEEALEEAELASYRHELDDYIGQQKAAEEAEQQAGAAAAARLRYATAAAAASYVAYIEAQVQRWRRPMKNKLPKTQELAPTSADTSSLTLPELLTRIRC